LGLQAYLDLNYSCDVGDSKNARVTQPERRWSSEDMGLEFAGRLVTRWVSLSRV